MTVKFQSYREYENTYTLSLLAIFYLLSIILEFYFIYKQFKRDIELKNMYDLNIANKL